MTQKNTKTQNGDAVSELSSSDLLESVRYKLEAAKIYSDGSFDWVSKVPKKMEWENTPEKAKEYLESLKRQNTKGKFRIVKVTTTRELVDSYSNK